MKKLLNEIKTIRSSQIGKIARHAIALSGDPNNPHTNLGMLGGTALGTGAMGAVYARPSGSTNRPDNKSVYKTYGQDSAYHAYINYARKNQDNPHVPKIYGTAKIASNKEGTRHLHVVKMEKLEPLSDYHPIRDLTSTPFEGRLFKTDMGNVMANLDSPRGNKLKEQYPHFHKILGDLAHKHAEDGFDMDLHMGNIMQRHDGTPVITDPMIKYKEMHPWGDMERGNPLSIPVSNKPKWTSSDQKLYDQLKTPEPTKPKFNALRVLKNIVGNGSK